MGEGPEESPISGSSTGSPGVGWVSPGGFTEAPAALNALRGGYARGSTPRSGGKPQIGLLCA